VIEVGIGTPEYRTQASCWAVRREVRESTQESCLEAALSHCIHGKKRASKIPIPQKEYAMSGTRLARRRFLQVATASAAAAAASCSRQKSRWRSLTESEALTLGAICDQIIPPDSAPGATQAGALEFIDRQLAGRYRRHRKAYSQGIAALDAIAVHSAGQPFAKLAPAAQLDLLTRLDEGRLGKGGDYTAARAFFNLAIAHTMQGFYGTPRHGGNREAASWVMLGVPVRPVRGRTAATPEVKS
jgi:gluconate 2-dehydrogenase gamma chain